MPTAWLRGHRLLGWAIFGPAIASKLALAQSWLELARATRIPPKDWHGVGL